MPENPESEGSRLITLKQIELDHGVSRSALHTYRRSSTFPQPVAVEGSTKTLYRADEVAAWFQANPKQQGKKRDRFLSQPQGEPVTTTIDPRIAILSALNEPPYSEVAEKRCVPWDEAEKLLDAYRADVLRKAADALDNSERLRDYTDDHMGDINEAANELRRMATEKSAADPE